MKKGIILAVIIVAVIGIFFAAKNTASKQPDKTVNGIENGAAVGGALTLSESNYDFGSISMKAGKVSKMFTITNDTSEPINIKKLSTSCMCTEAFIVGVEGKKGPFGMPGHGGFVPPVNELITPQSSTTVEVIFDPAAHGPAGIGKIERAVFIETGDEPQIITIKAMVTP